MWGPHLNDAGPTHVPVSSAPAGNVCPSRSGVRCVLSACRPEVLVLDVLGFRPVRREGVPGVATGRTLPVGALDGIALDHLAEEHYRPRTPKRRTRTTDR